MGCTESSQGQQTKIFSCHKIYIFKLSGKSSDKIIISQTFPVPLHVYFQHDKQGLSQFIKGCKNIYQAYLCIDFFQPQNQIQILLDFLNQQGNYKINLIFNWTEKAETYQIKSSDQQISLSLTQIQIKKGLLQYYKCLAKLCKQKGKHVKQQTITTHLYHQPQSNLILVNLQNFGESMSYTINFQQCIEKQNYDILSTLDIRQKFISRYCRSCNIQQKGQFIWLIAPKVPYNSKNSKKWGINYAVFGFFPMRQTLEMMQIGGGFNTKINLPPDCL